MGLVLSMADNHHNVKRKWVKCEQNIYCGISGCTVFWSLFCDVSKHLEERQEHCSSASMQIVLGHFVSLKEIHKIIC